MSLYQTEIETNIQWLRSNLNIAKMNSWGHEIAILKDEIAELEEELEALEEGE